MKRGYRLHGGPCHGRWVEVEQGMRLIRIPTDKGTVNYEWIRKSRIDKSGKLKEWNEYHFKEVSG